ncbi:unnamed protein product [Urochloa humidicola]
MDLQVGELCLQLLCSLPGATFAYLDLSLCPWRLWQQRLSGRTSTSNTRFSQKGLQGGLVTNILIIAEDIQVDPQACSRWALTRSIKDWTVLLPGGKVLPPLIHRPPRRKTWNAGMIQMWTFSSQALVG